MIICLGGLLDGNLPFKIQEMLGQKRIETINIPESQVPAISRMSTANPSFRGKYDVARRRQRQCGIFECA